jgi:hypothetical protein
MPSCTGPNCVENDVETWRTNARDRFVGGASSLGLGAFWLLLLRLFAAARIWRTSQPIPSGARGPYFARIIFGCLAMRPPHMEDCELR